MEKWKKNIKTGIFIMLGILFFYIGLKEDVLDNMWGINKIGIILSLIKKALSFVIAVLSCIILTINMKSKSKKSTIIEIIIVILCLIVISISSAKIIYKYNHEKGFIDYPTEILKYECDGKEYNLHIDNIEIEKKEENIFKTKTYYKMYLSDEKFKKIIYICIDAKYDLKRNEWHREHWEYYKDEEISANNDDLIKEEYKKVIKNLKKNEEETYAVSDINLDGIKELIIITGLSEADKTIHVYSFANGKIVSCGSTWSTHSTYFEEENKNFLIRLTYIQGGETLSYLSLENDKLKEEVVYRKNVLNGEQFETSHSQKAIEFININNLSIIDEM